MKRFSLGLSVASKTTVTFFSISYGAGGKNLTRYHLFSLSRVYLFLCVSPVRGVMVKLFHVRICVHDPAQVGQETVALIAVLSTPS